jgi:hypothetical protein
MGFIKNKKATVKVVVGIVLVIIVAVIIMAQLPFITKLFKSTDEMSKCSGITSSIMGEGTCKEKCASEEQSFKNFGGCPPEKEKTLVYCCINPDASEGSTAEVYATTGNNEYGFIVESFAIDHDNSVKRICTKNGEDNNPRYECNRQLAPLRLTMIINFKNTGSKPINIQAVAQKTILQSGYSPIVSYHVGNTGYLQKSPPNLNLEIIETIQPGKTYTFYPGARCYTTECKNAFHSDGLQIIDYSRSITIVGK